jgi:putative ABC transport system permease protein
MDSFSHKIADIVQKKQTKNGKAPSSFIPWKNGISIAIMMNWVNTGGIIDYVHMFTFVGLLVLVIACINFMNLSTARSEKRAREVGIRKAIGSQRAADRAIPGRSGHHCLLLPFCSRY